MSNYNFREVEGIYAIYYQGKAVKMRSGKSAWSTTGAAKNAMYNHLWGTPKEEIQELFSNGTFRIVNLLERQENE